MIKLYFYILSKLIKTKFIYYLIFLQIFLEALTFINKYGHN